MSVETLPSPVVIFFTLYTQSFGFKNAIFVSQVNSAITDYMTIKTNSLCKSFYRHINLLYSNQTL